MNEYFEGSQLDKVAVNFESERLDIEEVVMDEDLEQSRFCIDELLLLNVELVVSYWTSMEHSNIDFKLKKQPCLQINSIVFYKLQ